MIDKLVCIVSQSHLCRNPRVLKEAITLADNGYRVKILTAIYSAELLTEDLELIKDTAIGYEFYSNLCRYNLSSFLSRLIRRAATELQAKLHIESPLSLGFNIWEIIRMSIAEKANLYIMHQELPTLAGIKLHKKGYKIAFDIEDWYSEDLLPVARIKRPIKLLKNLEKSALQNGVYCSTTSFAMANALKSTYNVDTAPYVIYNSFNSVDCENSTSLINGPIRLYWFSQTIGPGRGLEFFISCMAKSSFKWEITLRGDISPLYADHLKHLISNKDQLNILPVLKNEEIIWDMKIYDIGLALEPDSPPNKDLTISNKFFHYMCAGLPIIASFTQGHAEIGSKHPEIIFLYKQNQEKELVEILDNLGKRLKADKNRLLNSMLTIYRENYSWQNESKKLIRLVKNALESQG